MRNELEKFHHTVDILVKAYLNDTLQHGNCYACAVGNMVAAGLGCNLVVTNYRFPSLHWDNGEPYPAIIDAASIHDFGWGALFSTDENEDGDKVQEIKDRHLHSARVQRHITATGYTWEELARIEFAFESVSVKGKDRMFRGLMAVVDVLADIHKVDLTIKEEAKLLFVK